MCLIPLCEPQWGCMTTSISKAVFLKYFWCAGVYFSLFPNESGLQTFFTADMLAFHSNTATTNNITDGSVPTIIVTV